MMKRVFSVAVLSLLLSTLALAQKIEYRLGPQR